MVHYLKIENFGPINNEVEINFEVADNIEQDAYEVPMPDGRRLIKLAYIYGPNASGKTTVLEAFEFLRKLLLDPLETKSVELAFEPFLFCENPLERPSRFEFSFYAEGIRYLYQVIFSRTSVWEEKLVFYRSAKPTELFSRKTDVERRLSSIHFGTQIKVPIREKALLESNTLHNTTVMGAYARTNVDIPALEILYKWLDRFFLGMVRDNIDLTDMTASRFGDDQKFKTWITYFLNKADEQISDIEVTDFMNRRQETIFSKIQYKYGPPPTVPPVSNEQSSFNILSQKPEAKFHLREKSLHKSRYGLFEIDFVHKVDQGKKYTLPFILESSGTKRYFGLGSPLYDLIHGSHFLSVDEVGSSLHSDLLIHFLQTFLLNSTDSQLLITTHDLAMLSHQDFIRWDALWFCEKKEDGSISLYSAADFDSSILRKGGNLINAYRAGRLGAKPNLGSPYLIED